MKRADSSLASRLKKRITLQQENRTSDAQGGFTSTWQNVATVWAEIEPIRSQERDDKGKPETVSSFRITLRYRADIHPAMRVLWQDRYFSIRGMINPNESDESIELLAEENL